MGEINQKEKGIVFCATQESALAVRDLINQLKSSSKQQAFLTFVLAHYISTGVEELEETKPGPLLKLKYNNNAIADAFADLGSPEVVRHAFVGFQKYLLSACGKIVTMARHAALWLRGSVTIGHHQTHVQEVIAGN